MFGFDSGLEYLCSCNVKLGQEVIGPVAEGLRINFQVLGGEWDGPRARGKIRPGGMDSAVLRTDGVIVLDIRSTFETHDGAAIYLVGTGLSYTDGDLYERALRGDMPPAIPIRESVRFTTANPDYLWINRLQCVATGEAVLPLMEVHLDVYALK